MLTSPSRSSNDLPVAPWEDGVTDGVGVGDLLTAIDSTGVFSAFGRRKSTTRFFLCRVVWLRGFPVEPLYVLP